MDPGAGNFKTQFQDEHTVFESFFFGAPVSGAPFAAVFLVQRWTSLSEVVANKRGIHDNPVSEGSNYIASESRRTSWERLRADEKESVRARKLEEDFVWRRIRLFQLCLCSQRKVGCTCTLRHAVLSCGVFVV